MQQTIGLPAPATTQVGPISLQSVRKFAIMGIQIFGLWAISAGSTWIVERFHVPIPGNVVGLCALFVALMSGAIKPRWLDIGGGMLTKHLAFFFVPITVGLMGFGATFAHAGVALAVTLVVSAALGMLAAGYTTQLLAARGAR